MQIIVTVKKPDGKKVEYVKDASLITIKEMLIWFNSLTEDGSELNIKEYK